MPIKSKITIVGLTEKQLNAVLRILANLEKTGKPQKRTKKDKDECVATLEYLKKGV